MSEKYLLTLSIPTYNRAIFLETCLEHIGRQFPGNELLIEWLVIDNHSSDSTPAVVRRYIDLGFPIRYIRNEENIGADRNIQKCFREALGKYVLIFGDDDILLDRALIKIIDLLQKGEYGVVYLQSYGFSNDFEKEKPKRILKRNRTIVMEQTDRFVSEVNYWLTFISGNIVNKSLLNENRDFDRFLDTNLIQLSWVIPALLKAHRNAVMNERFIAMKTENTGGYQLFRVFGTNMNRIMDAFRAEGLSEKAIRKVNQKLILTFFPSFIVKLRSDRGMFGIEDGFAELYPLYKNYFLFWICLVPLIRLPLLLARLWHFNIRVVNKLNKMLRG